MQDQVPRQDDPQGDDGDELGRARRRAFARGATPADIEHLRALEELADAVRRERDPADEATPAATDLAEHPVTAGLPAPGEDEDDRGEHPGQRPWIRPAALGLIGGVLVGILLATVASPLFGVQGPWGITIYDAVPGAGEAGPSLAIFDRTPSERDVLGAAGFPQIFGPDSGAPDVRWLADLDGATVYAARGVQGGEATVCLVAIRADTAGGSCATVADFEVAGIGGTFEGISVRWGPYGLAPWVPYEPDAR